MKRFTIFLGVLTIGISLSSAATPAQLYKTVGGNPSGYIFDSSPTAIVFATPSETSPKQTVKLTELKGVGLKRGVRLTAREDILAEARAAFSSGDYRKAASDFRKVAEDYTYIQHIPNNFASEAKFYEIECYKRAGAYKAMTKEMATPLGKSTKTLLGEYYQKAVKMHKLWALFGTGDTAKIEKEISIYQKPVVGSEALLPSPSYIKMPPSDLAQVAFIRGKLYEQKGENENALRDYYRVFTLGQRDASLSKSAMAAAMKLQAEDPRLKSSNEKAKAAAIRQMQSLAYNYSKRFPGSTLPLDLQDYNTGPRIDLVVQKAPEPVATPAAAAAPAKAPPKPDPKAKGKPQPKGKKPQSKGKPKGKKGK